MWIQWLIRDEKGEFNINFTVFSDLIHSFLSFLCAHHARQSHWLNTFLIPCPLEAVSSLEYDLPHAVWCSFSVHVDILLGPSKWLKSKLTFICLLSAVCESCCVWFDSIVNETRLFRFIFGKESSRRCARNLNEFELFLTPRAAVAQRRNPQELFKKKSSERRAEKLKFSVCVGPTTNGDGDELNSKFRFDQTPFGCANWPIKRFFYMACCSAGNW